MENATPGVTAGSDDEKSPEQIEREMLDTRDALTEKVAALESQVMGTIQTATNTVTDTVQAVRDAVTSAPTAVSDTVKQTVTAMKDSVRDMVGSFSVSGCVESNPWAALGTTTAAGFLAGYFFGGRRSRVPAPGKLDAAAHAQPAPFGLHDHRPMAAVAAEPGLIGGLLASVGKEVRLLAEDALSTAIKSLKESVHTQVPTLVSGAVQQVTDRVASAVHVDPEGSARVGGRDYAATAPTPNRR